MVASVMTGSIEVQSLDSTAETTTFDNGKLETGRVGDVTFMRGTVEPGWVWSRDVAGEPGTASCSQSHRIYVVEGTMTVEMDDGTSEMLTPGDIATIPPGHDAWVEGDERVVFIDVDM